MGLVALLVGACLFGAADVAWAVVADSVYVANFGNDTVTIFAPAANGDVAPAATLGGPATGLAAPVALTLDGAGTLYVANRTVDSITVYLDGATGNAAPLRTIAGAATGLFTVEAVALDVSGALFVSDADSVSVFAPGAAGDVVPVRTITGATTGLSAPTGLAFDASGVLYVANSGNDSITEYGVGVDGDASPLRTIVGAMTGLDNPTGVAIDASGTLYVANRESNTVTEYAAGANGNAAPVRSIAGGATGISNPFNLGLAFDSAGTLYVANQTGSVTEFAAAANGNVAPLRTIQGGSTGLDQPVAAVVAGTSTPLAPTVATDIHNAAHTPVVSVPAGSTVHDHVTLTGSGPTPTGTVDLTFFTGSTACTGPSTTEADLPLTGGTATSANHGPLAAGSYSFQAHYGGDTTYNSADSLCEALTVTGPGGGGGGGGGGGADDDDDDDDGGGGHLSDRGGRITIVEKAAIGRTGSFGFHTKELDATTFRLPGDAKRTFKGLDAGTYTVAQDLKDGWRLEKIVCQDPTKNTKVILDTRRAQIKLKAGEHVVCTFTNKKKK